MVAQFLPNMRLLPMMQTDLYLLCYYPFLVHDREDVQL